MFLNPLATVTEHRVIKCCKKSLSSNIIVSLALLPIPSEIKLIGPSGLVEIKYLILLQSLYLDYVNACCIAFDGYFILT